MAFWAASSATDRSGASDLGSCSAGFDLLEAGCADEEEAFGVGAGGAAGAAFGLAAAFFLGFGGSGGLSWMEGMVCSS